MSDLTQFDHYLRDDGPVALVIREHLMSVEGSDGVVFPATFASGDTFQGGYNIDAGPNGTNVCLIDSIGSQANRIEPIFAKKEYASLIPQIVFRMGEKLLNILEAGHRAGDAVVRCTQLHQEIQNAFRAVLKGNAEPIAKIAPTSLVFGVWDSRDTQAKLPRLIASTIRAFNVRKLTRHALFVPACEYVNNNLLDAPVDRATRDAYAERGFVHIPVSNPENIHGGVIADGGIRREATLGLAALRLINAGTDEIRTLFLRRYILGLALTAFTYTPSGYLRQGCLLVLDPSKAKECEFVEVHPTGHRTPVKITHDMAVAYAKESAKAFGVGESKTVDFEKERAMTDLKGDGDNKTKKKKGK
jgi:CRISPR-associated protein Csb1